MIMKHERNEDKNDFLLFLLPEIFTVIAGSTAVYAMGIFGKQLSVENALRNAVMTAMGLAVAGFSTVPASLACSANLSSKV